MVRLLSPKTTFHRKFKEERAVQLGLDGDDLNKCVQCGLCLPSCPTFRVTGDEALSPRGRIALMRSVQLHDAPLTNEILESFSTCVQCRGCEPACPSAVPYGRLIETTKSSLASNKAATPWWLRRALSILERPRLLRGVTSALALGQRARVVPKSLDPGVRVPLRQDPIHASGTDVYLFTGCVMDAWQREIHQATKRVLEAAGFGVTPTGDMAPCCGALHIHAGLESKAHELAEQSMKALPPLDDKAATPILVNSAGCGAALKEYGQILDTPAASRFSERVFDIFEFLALHLDRLPAANPLNLKVAIQDPCHLRHVQKQHLSTRQVLTPFVSTIVELDDDGLCCGAGGAYSVTEPALSNAIRQRKLTVLERCEYDIVAAANPGCGFHLASVGIDVAHPISLVDQALNP